MALVVGTNCGFVTTAPTTDPAGDINTMDAYCRACKHTAPAGTIKVIEMGWWCDNATQASNFEVGIYTNDSVNDCPKDLLAGADKTNAKGTTAGWKKVTGLNIAITAGTIYWLALELDNTTTTTNIDYTGVAGTRYNYFTSATTLPDPSWTPASSLNGTHAIYAVYETAAGTNIKINIGDVWKDVAEIKINIGDVWKSVVKVQQNIGDVWKTVFG